MKTQVEYLDIKPIINMFRAYFVSGCLHVFVQMDLNPWELADPVSWNIKVWLCFSHDYLHFR